jgi:membrane fusion protein (multidrug efflux system)
MRKLIILILTLSVGLMAGCGKSGSPPDKAPEKKASTQNSTSRQAGGGSGSANQKRGATPAESPDVDIDKLDIPDEMKAAIKSGQIPKEKVAAMLAQMQGGEEAPLVNVESVSRKNLNSYLILNGVVEPERTVAIYSRLSAYVKDIIREEGAYVKENDILARLDDTEIKIGYQQANIQLEQARLTYEEAKKTLESSQELVKKELISQQEYLAAENQFNQRKLDYDNRQEAFKNLQLQLNWTEIRSLAEGYITERLIEVGTKVNANQQVYTIEDFSPLLIRVFAPSADSINLTPGMIAEITTDILKGTTFNGNVKLINPRIDVQSGTVKVTVETYDDSRRLKPGMFVEVRIIVGQKENILVIPRKAVLYKQNKTFVFVVNQMQAAQREVKLGLIEEDQVEIVDGLVEGDTIVVVGIESLKDGQRVKVVQ